MSQQCGEGHPGEACLQGSLRVGARGWARQVLRCPLDPPQRLQVPGPVVGGGCLSYPQGSRGCVCGGVISAGRRSWVEGVVGVEMEFIFLVWF